MKKFFILLFLGLNFLFCGTNNASTISNASETGLNHVYIFINLNDDSSDYALNTNLEEAFSEVVNSIDSTEELTCTMKIKVKISAGVLSGEAEVTVSGPCSEVQAKAEEITKECIAKAKKSLSAAR